MHAVAGRPTFSRWIGAVSCVMVFHAGAATPAEPDSTDRPGLIQQHRALQLERDLIRDLTLERPGEPYLVFDLRVPVVYLKAAGRILREMPPSHAHLDESLGRAPQVLTLVSRIDPVTLEPGTGGRRLRGREFPVDFRSRLVEGPRERTRFYYSPSLLVAPNELMSDTAGISLSPADIKALSSALDPGTRAILIPGAGSPPPSPGSPAPADTIPPR